MHCLTLCGCHLFGATQTIEKSAWMNGFGQHLEMVPVRLGVPQQIRGCRVPREENDTAAGEMRGDANGSIDAVHAVHHDIANEHIGPQRDRRIKCRFAAIDRAGFNPAFIKDKGQSVGNDALIVNHQNARAYAVIRHLFVPLSLWGKPRKNAVKQKGTKLNVSSAAGMPGDEAWRLKQGREQKQTEEHSWELLQLSFDCDCVLETTLPHRELAGYPSDDHASF